MKLLVDLGCTTWLHCSLMSQKVIKGGQEARVHREDSAAAGSEGTQS
jgi:hypothetical protein